MTAPFSTFKWRVGIMLPPISSCYRQKLTEEKQQKFKTVGRPPGEFGVSKSMGYDIFPSVLWHCWLGDTKGIRALKTGCWFVGGDLTGDLHDL